MAFIDEARFFVKAGDGGNGCISFRREKYVPKGGPDGGDGGRGGNVVIQASRRLHSLIDFRYRSHYIAGKGAHGQGKNKHGRSGTDRIVKVPVGSVLKDDESGELLADLLEDGDRFLAVRGGRGGLGNSRFTSSRNRTPRRATPGGRGEERWLRIELKLLADVGLVGLTNAGKSTLLSRLSAATPKVAPYPFTTLEPQLGVLYFEGHEPCILADIPGLVQGAHAGVGLGYKFLRHIERTRLLLHLIDVGQGREQALADWRVLEEELGRFDEHLLGRERLIVLNKIDLLEVDDAVVTDLLAFFAARDLPALAVSAQNGTGLDELKEQLAGRLAALDTVNEVKEV